MNGDLHQYKDARPGIFGACAVVTKYQRRISSPLLDRIDIHIEVPRVDYEKLSGDRMGETSEAIRARVQAARDIQQKRFSNNGSSDIICNADMRIGEIRQFCKLQDEGVVLSLSKHQSLMRAAMTQLNLSACAHHRILAGAHNRRLGWERGDPLRTSAGGAAISSQNYEGMINIDYNYSLIEVAPIAQLDRALVFGTSGWEFESLWAHFSI